MPRYHVDVFLVGVTDDARVARWIGPLYACRIERTERGRRDELALEYGPDKVDALARARDYVRYLRDMERMYKLPRTA